MASGTQLPGTQLPGTRRAAERTPTLLAAAVLPAVALAVAGAFHPRDLGPATAVRWTDVHLVALPLFGLLGLAPWLLLRRRSRVLGLVGAVLAWVHAAFYTGLDVLAGIGAGTLQERAGGAGVGEMFARGDQLARVGTTAYLLLTVLAAVSLLTSRTSGATGAIGALGAVVVAVAAVSYLSSHIWWPRGGLTMLALGVGWSLLALAAVRARPVPSRRATADGRVTP